MTTAITWRALRGVLLCSAITITLCACKRPDLAPATGPAPAASTAAMAAVQGASAPAAAPPPPAPPLLQPTHPLDGLTASEFSAVVKLLQGSKLADDKSFFPLIELFEPDKAAVLAWKDGDPLVRRAYVNFKGLQGTQEALVNLSTAKVEKVGRLTSEPMVMLEEFMGSMNLALADPGFVAGLALRGFKPADVFCLPLTAGNFLQQADKGKRLMKVHLHGQR